MNYLPIDFLRPSSNPVPNKCSLKELLLEEVKKYENVGWPKIDRREEMRYATPTEILPISLNLLNFDEFIE
jgi:hypothetical protein